MLVERSDLMIKDGMEDEFAFKMQALGIPLLSKVPGVTAVQIGRGVENPGKFMLLVEWTEMSAHTAFKTNPIYPEFLLVLKPFMKGGAMEHFNMG